MTPVPTANLDVALVFSLGDGSAKDELDDEALGE